MDLLPNLLCRFPAFLALKRCRPIATKYVYNLKQPLWIQIGKLKEPFQIYFLAEQEFSKLNFNTSTKSPILSVWLRSCTWLYRPTRQVARNMKEKLGFHSNLLYLKEIKYYLAVESDVERKKLEEH